MDVKSKLVTCRGGNNATYFYKLVIQDILPIIVQEINRSAEKRIRSDKAN